MTQVIERPKVTDAPPPLAFPEDQRIIQAIANTVTRYFCALETRAGFEPLCPRNEIARLFARRTYQKVWWPIDSKIFWATLDSPGLSPDSSTVDMAKECSYTEAPVFDALDVVVISQAVAYRLQHGPREEDREEAVLAGQYFSHQV